MAAKKITTPLTDEVVKDLRAGDAVEITGVIYQARDAAHKRLVALIDAGEELPFELAGAVVYYMGPSPAKPGNVIGSAGPTTSGRMDAYAPLLMRHGLKGMIGKGLRTAEVKQAMQDRPPSTSPPPAAPARCWPSASSATRSSPTPSSAPRRSPASKSSTSRRSSSWTATAATCTRRAARSTRARSEPGPPRRLRVSTAAAG